MLARIALPLLLPSLLLAQGNVTTIAPSADTTLYLDAFGDTANGAGDSLFLGVNTTGVVRRILIKFDVATALPANAIVTGVEVAMNTAQSPYALPLQATLHRVTNSWNEGTANAGAFQGVGTTAGPGDCTWLHRSWPTQFWTTPGGDYDPTPHGSTATSFFGPFTWPSTPDMVADVQSWLASPATNYGWLMRTNEQVGRQVRKIDSRESLPPAAGPRLTIRWIQPGGWIASGEGCGVPNAPVLSGVGNFAVGGSAGFATQGPAFTPMLTLFAFFLQQPGTPLGGGCTFHLPFGAITPGLRFLDGAGHSTEVLAIPNDPSFAGLRLASQAAVLDSSQPTSFSLTNGLFAVVQ